MERNKKRKWREGAVLLLVLLLTSSLLWLGLSRWKRTPHIYAYDEGTGIDREKQLAQTGQEEQQEEEEEQDQENQENQTSSPPQEQREDSPNEDSREDASDARQKKPGKNTQNHKSQQGEPDSEDEPEEDGDGEGGDDGSGDGDGTGDGAGEGEGIGTGDGNGDGGESGDGNGSQENDSQGDSVSPTVQPEATPVQVVRTTPTPPITTRVPSATPRVTDAPDEIVSIACSWADKDTLVYKKDIPRDTIQVKATYSSGKMKVLDESDYVIAGLKNDSIGEHTMTVIYGEISCKLTYKVNNYIKYMEYDWPTKDKCYRGEVIDDYALTVTVHMADESEFDLEDGQYTISGIDNKKMDVEQTFTIQYQDVSLTGTCRFISRNVTYIDQYYSGGTLQSTNTTSEPSDSVKEGDVIANDTGNTVTKGGTTYKVTSTTVVVDGKGKTLPYTIKERNFDIKITRVYEAVE